MTRKDYEKIASVLNLAATVTINDYDEYYGQAIVDIAEGLATVFASDNAAFDKTKFLAAVWKRG